MTSRATNLLFIMSDEHQARALGCAGHPLVKTPNLDRLANRGTRFTGAYTNSSICVPARAAFATGRYVHDIGYWCNAHPYDGRVPGWGHRLQETGHPVLSIGKLHYRDEADPTGFDTQVVPMYVVKGVGDVFGAVRDRLPERRRSRRLAEEIGPGESGYTRYDRQIRDEACRWLSEEAPNQDKPWVLFVSFVCPHFPLIAPPEFYALYPPADTITAYARSSMTISAGSWRRSMPLGWQTTRASSIPATMAIISAPGGSGANRTCTRKRRRSR
jgi:choline-sulfatase